MWRARMGHITRSFPIRSGWGVVSEATSETMRYILEQVVAEGSGKRAKLPGYRVGGKTATSEKLFIA